jgi:hypothetical protein
LRRSLATELIGLQFAWVLRGYKRYVQLIFDQKHEPLTHTGQ